MALFVTNTLTRQVEELILDKTQPVKLYVCGITPYDHAHIGHGRVYVTFDLLLRLLQHDGYTVTYVRNVTDVDDKLINKAAQRGDATQFAAVAQEYYTSFVQAMDKLACLHPNSEPRITGSMPEIITFIDGLIKAEHAYQVDSDVYFDINSLPAYGKLSGRDSDALQAGARVDIDTRKRNPGDFALWKGNNEHVFWDSPWGKGRPGWHIECSAMAKKELGITLDIHGGGMDLIFPHHENEIAQSEALHQKTFSRYWMHNAFININKEKMSKSLGNSVSLNDMFAKNDPMVVRFYYLQHQYRNPIDFCFEDLNAAQTAYKKIIAHYGITHNAQALQHDPVITAMLDALRNDLNTPKFFGLVFEHISRAKTEPAFGQAVKELLQQVLGLSLQPLPEAVLEITPEIQSLLDQREEARLAKNWALADKFRDELLAKGYKIQDRKA